MSAVIVYSDFEEKGIKIPNATISRKVELPVSWSSLAIGCRFNMTTGSRINMTGTPQFIMGLSSGTASIGDLNIPHFFGMGNQTATLTYASASTSYYALAAINEYHIQTGSALIGTDYTTATMYCFLDENIGKKPALIWYVTRNGTSYTSNIFFPSVAAGFSGLTKDVFLTLMQTSAPSFAGHSFGNQAGTETVREDIYGVFDHINISWDRESPNADLIIYDVAVSILA